jgi:hypothetical protein
MGMSRETNPAKWRFLKIQGKVTLKQLDLVKVHPISVSQDEEGTKEKKDPK